MSKRLPVVTSLAGDAEKKRRQRRLAKRYEEESFREYISTARKHIQLGKSLSETREQIGLYNSKNDDLWDDIVYVLANNYSKPESLVLEWTIRQQTRYSMALEVYKMAKEQNDLGEMNKAIMIMMKVDENSLELQQRMGLLKPVNLDDNDPNQGEGITHEQLLLTEERILRKYQLQREASQPVTIDVLNRSDSRGETNTVEQVALVENTTCRSFEGDSIP